MVSIIIPFKNPMPYFEDCLKSILRQSYSKLQIILVNDGSTDSSLKIAKEHQIKDHRIKIVANNGSGIIEALKTGANLASGKYICRMDADDLMDENKIEDLRNLLLLKGENFIAIGKVAYFSSEKEMGNGYINYAQWLNKLTANSNNFNEIYKECSIPSCCWMMYLNDFLKIKGFQDLIFPEDYHFAFKVYYGNLKIATTQKTIHFWRDHPKRTSRNEKIYSFENFIPLKLYYLKKYEFKEHDQLVLWGAGKKGKKIAKELIKDSFPFIWITNNSKKIGHIIYNNKIGPLNYLKKEVKKIVICGISDPNFKLPNDSRFNRFFKFY
jgi:glycosyltransferase involved in cell wall biosynthesis